MVDIDYSNEYPNCSIGICCLIHSPVSIEPFTVIRNDVIIKKNTWIKEHCVIYDNVEIGKSCKIRAQCVICENTIIGDKCEFGVGVILMDHYKMVAFLDIEDKIKPPKIGKGCRIGTGSHLHAGCFLTNNVILLPNSIVREDVVLEPGVYGMKNGILQKLRDLKHEEIIS